MSSGRGLRCLLEVAKEADGRYRLGFLRRAEALIGRLSLTHMACYESPAQASKFPRPLTRTLPIRDARFPSPRVKWLGA